MPRTTATSTGQQNKTYEQTLNQADRSSSASSTKGDRMARTTDRGSSVTESADPALDRVTTPPVDDKGTRGKATINNTAAKDQANRTQRAGSASANNMDASCRIGESTSEFALKLEGGGMMRFDTAGNAKIAQQLHSADRLQHKTKIFRTKVKGSVQGGIITVDSIQI